MAGELVTASIMNTHVRDNLLHIRGYGEHSCVAYHNTTQTVTAGNTTALNLNSEVFDTGTMHDTSSNNNQVVVPVTGKWLAFGTSLVASNNNGTGVLNLRVNGSTIRSAAITSESADFGDITANVFAYHSMTAGQYFELAGTAATNDFTFGSGTAAQATRLEVIGPFPNP